MNQNSIRSFVERWLAAVCQGNAAEFSVLVAPDVVDLNTNQATSQAAFAARAEAVYTAFGELSGSVDELLIDELLIDELRIAWRWTLTGIHRAPFLGHPASGKRITLNGVNFQHLKDGRVAAHYTLVDAFAIIAQLTRP